MSVKKKLDQLSPENKIKFLEDLVAKQAEKIEGMQKARFSLPTGPVRKKGKAWIRAIIPDSHGASINKDAAQAFLADLEALKPAEIVMLGDHLDCGGFLSAHSQLFVPETDSSFEDDVEAANLFLDEIQKRAGRVPTYYIMGNHEQRIERWIIKQTMGHPGNASYFRRMFGPEQVLGLEKRKITPIFRGDTYSGLRRRGTIRLGHCLFTHGVRCGVHAAKQNLDDAAANIVFGHTHRISSHVKETSDGLIGAWSVGCLCELHPMWGDTKTTNWAHGFGFQVCKPDGTFLHITVPIIDGCSYLQKLLN